jgi:hypothetical protein
LLVWACWFTLSKENNSEITFLFLPVNILCVKISLQIHLLSWRVANVIGAVMRRVTFVAIFIFAMAVLMVGISFVGEASCSGTLIVTVSSPVEKVYTSSSVVISISAGDPANLTGPESYSLDGGPQVIIATAPLGVHSLTGSAVLSLPNGVHEIVGVGITWYNGTADGIFFSEPVLFTVAEPSTTPSEKPQSSEQDVILGVAVTVAVVCVGLGLLVYLIKRK